MHYNSGGGDGYAHDKVGGGGTSNNEWWWW